jgi:uncharacterized 2Fe-2S/4Fe-4S cluster protein (DUF4445 family)
LIRYCGLKPGKIQRVYLTGAFGSFMDVDNAMDIGLLPRIAKERILRFGNGALAGDRAMLCSRRGRSEAEGLESILTHLKPNEIEGERFQYLEAQKHLLRLTNGQNRTF